MKKYLVINSDTKNVVSKPVSKKIAEEIKSSLESSTGYQYEIIEYSTNNNAKKEF